MDALCRLEDLVELGLELGRLAQRPVGFLLMAEDDIIEDRVRHAEQPRQLGVNLGALGRDRVALQVENGYASGDTLQTP